MFPNQYRDGYCIIYYDDDDEQHVELGPNHRMPVRALRPDIE